MEQAKLKMEAAVAKSAVHAAIGVVGNQGRQYAEGTHL